MTDMIAKARADVTVLKTLLDHDVEPTPAVIHAVWQWFLDVDINVPLPVMTLSTTERNRLAREIVAELDSAFADLAHAASALSDPDAISGLPQVVVINDLWREVAGCYAEVLNASVTVLSDEEKQEVYPRVIDMIAASSGLEEDEVRDRIAHDPVLRLMLRRSGVNPDEIG